MTTKTLNLTEEQTKTPLFFFLKEKKKRQSFNGYVEIDN